MAAQPAGRDGGDRASYPHKWMILIAIGLSLLMGTVNGSIVNVAMPTLLTYFDTTFGTIQWVSLAYFVTLTVLMLGIGRLADIVGKKRIFLTGQIIFLLASALCGLAQTVQMLILFRSLQAIGSAMMLALGVAIVTETWPEEERGKAIGTSGGLISLGVVAGPVLGGLILESLNWRWIFLVNFPLGLLTIALVLRYVPSLTPSGPRESFDFLGASILGVALVALSLALTVGQSLGYGEPRILILFFIAAVATPLFLFVQQRTRFPMLDLGLFRNASFSLNLFTGMMTFVSIAGVVLLLPFYLELVLGLSQLQVGLLMATVPVLLSIAAPLAGTLSDRLGTRPVTITGLVVLLSGYLLASTFNETTTPLLYILLLSPVAVGMGIFQSPNNSAIMGAAPPDRLGIASGTLSLTRTLGQTIGISVLGTVFAARLQVYAGAGVGVNEALPAHLVLAIRDELWLAGALTALALMVALMAWRSERVAARQPAVST